MGILNDDPSILQMRRLGTVRRWGIVLTNRTQTVDAHLFQVLVAARFLMCFQPFQEASMTAQYRADLYEAIMRSDAAESLSNDLPAPFKSYFLSYQAEEWEGFAESEGPMRQHIKAADMLEAIAFLNEEIAMGNHTVQQVYDSLTNAFTTRFRELDPLFILSQWKAQTNPNRHPLLDLIDERWKASNTRNGKLMKEAKDGV